MRWFHFLLLQLFLIIIISGVVYLHKDKVTLVKVPPQSIAQWYKPINKRQVWLHNMFKLRRELQAVEYYSAKGDSEHLSKWTGLFSEHYLKIGEMMPEWRKKIDLDALKELQQLSTTNDELTPTITAIKQSCINCHNDYQTITATLYRTADFSTFGELAPSVNLKQHMLNMTEQINFIKIAAEDGMQDIAQSVLSRLDKDIKLLGKTCDSCHANQDIVYPDLAMNNTLASLQESLTSGTLKEQGRHLGTLAVIACARCHGSHRVITDTKELLIENRDMLELLRHRR